VTSAPTKESYQSPPLIEPREHVTEEKEREITREVILLVAELHPLVVRDGRSVIPEDASEDLAERIQRYEGELL
jgi:hypothetical protein